MLSVSRGWQVCPAPHWAHITASNFFWKYLKVVHYRVATHSVLRSNISEPGALKQKPLITHRVDKVMTIEKAEPVVFTPFTRCKIIQIQHLQK